MKNLVLATASVFGLSGAAYADGMAFNTSAEYAIEAETFTVEGGAAYTMNDFTFSGTLTFEDTQTTDLDFVGIEVGVNYDINDNAAAYVLVEADEDLDYTETTVGIAFNF